MEDDQIQLFIDPSFSLMEETLKLDFVIKLGLSAECAKRHRVSSQIATTLGSKALFILRTVPHV